MERGLGATPRATAVQPPLSAPGRTPEPTVPGFDDGGPVSLQVGPALDASQKEAAADPDEIQAARSSGRTYKARKIQASDFRRPEWRPSGPLKGSGKGAKSKPAGPELPLVQRPP